MKIKSHLKRTKNLLIKNFLPNGFYIKQHGYCPCCDKDVVFFSSKSWLRDYFVCSNCNSIPRERALMLVIEKHLPNWKELIVHESSPGERGASLKLRLNCPNYQSSQYFPREPLGSMINNFRNENLEELTLFNKSVDLFITQDVLEHVCDPSKVFSEIGRVLKNGGMHIFTVPIINKHEKSEVWALRGNDGSPIFLKEPEYHGYSRSQWFSCNMHWGFDIVDHIKKSSNLDTIIETIDNFDFGIRAEYIEVLVSKKNII